MWWESLKEAVVNSRVLYPLTIILLTAILARTTLYLVEGSLKILRRKNSKTINHRLLNVIETPLVVVIILVGFELAIRKVIIEHEGFTNLIETGAIIILTYALIRIGNIILGFWSQRMTKAKGQEFHSEVLPLMKSVISIVLSILGVILLLQVWQIEIKNLVTSLGVVGVVLGIAFQQTLINIFGGISLIMDNSFHQGDLIQLEDGEMGEVMEINLRSTKLKNFDAESIIVPNGQLANKKLINLAQPTPTVRVKIPVSVAYGSDPTKVKKILHDSLRHHPDILTMPRRRARFVGFGESSIDFELFFFINQYKRIWDVRDEVLTQVYKDLYANGIEIPFPIRTIVQAKKGQYKQKWEDEPEEEESQTTSSQKKTKKS
ncbi:mechanosensitive ion channel family protein [Candidatus Woesearchaeota archaeon]|nr:mechanosensitive ion channel family protein [Candidatus Woesearchaeota archaeon]